METLAEALEAMFLANTSENSDLEEFLEDEIESLKASDLPDFTGIFCLDPDIFKMKVMSNKVDYNPNDPKAWVSFKLDTIVETFGKENIARHKLPTRYAYTMEFPMSWINQYAELFYSRDSDCTDPDSGPEMTFRSLWFHDYPYNFGGMIGAFNIEPKIRPDDYDFWQRLHEVCDEKIPPTSVGVNDLFKDKIAAVDTMIQGLKRRTLGEISAETKDLRKKLKQMKKERDSAVREEKEATENLESAQETIASLEDDIVAWQTKHHLSENTANGLAAIVQKKDQEIAMYSYL